FTRNEAQHVTDVFIDDLLAAEGNDLVQERLRIAHASLRCLDDVRQCTVVDLDPLAISYLAEMRLNFRRRNCSEYELLASRQDRGRKLMPFGCRHDENHMRRRLFQDLQ